MGSSPSTTRPKFSDLKELPKASLEEIPGIVEGLKKKFATGETKSYEWRMKQLKAMEQLILDSQDALIEAVHKDIHRPANETVAFEMGFTLDETRKAQKELKSWMEVESVPVPVSMKLDSNCHVYAEPKGVILVISPWNAGFILSITPLIGVIAAGNCALLKPPELSPAVSMLLANLIPKYLDNEAIKVVEGDATTGGALLKEQWDHIVFTGGGKVAKIVAKAAAEFLTPVTLELGGKCPCFVDETADLNVAANRIGWAKCANSGQVCMCVDYLLLTPKIEEEFIKKLKETIKKFYGEDPKKSNDYSRMISKGHFLRVKGLVEPVRDKIIFGGEMDEEDKYIAPTFIKEPPLDSVIMQEEIFGPVLPIFVVKDVKEAVEFIRKLKDKPLFTYMYSTNSDDIEYYIDNLSSGQVGINECMFNYACIDAPFGGIGASGMGAYRGKNSFLEFSHRKSVLKRKTWLDLDVRYPPYDEKKFKQTEKLFVQGKLF